MNAVLASWRPDLPPDRLKAIMRLAMRSYRNNVYYFTHPRRPDPMSPEERHAYNSAYYAEHRETILAKRRADYARKKARLN
ncbi:MAG: hypothetical protein ABSG38_16080 [Spirochaetia bacterium]|jgi:hypothetical protein